MIRVAKKLVEHLPRAKFSFALVFISQFYGASVAAASPVSCEETPHTPFETSICANPALRALDKELTTTLTRAVAGNVVAPTQAVELRNGIAKLCWREAEPMLQACLLSAELGAFKWVAARLDHVTSGVATRGFSKPRSSDLSNGHWDTGRFERASSEWRSADPSARRVTQLKKQLAVAESYLKITGDTDLIVATIVGLLDAVGEQKNALQSRAEQSKTILNLERRVAQGCKNNRSRRDWHSSLRQHDLSCVGRAPKVRVTATLDF